MSDNAILQRYEYAYNQDGNKSQETFTDKDGQTHTWDWVYDQLGRLIEETHDNTNNSLDYAAEYKYDLVGNRLEKRGDQGNNGTVETVVKGVFDQNDRLTSETEENNGQAVKRTDYVYNQTEEIAKTVINLLTSQVETATSLEYNAQGRLAKITIDSYTNGSKTQSITQEYTYDSSGIKIRQVESLDADADGVADSQSVTSYLNEARNHTGYAQVLEERLGENGQPVKVTTYTLGHDVLAQFDAVNGYLALLADGHGSTRAVANMAGQIAQQYSYDAYGNALGFNANQALTNLLYSGEQFNPVSGLQYLRARWYNPQSGRFNRLDPYAGNRQSPLSFHKYAYAHMNPVMGVDPSGRFFTLPQILVGLSTVSGVAYGWYMGYKATGSWLSAKSFIYAIAGAAVGYVSASAAVTQYLVRIGQVHLTTGVSVYAAQQALNKTYLQIAKITAGKVTLEQFFLTAWGESLKHIIVGFITGVAVSTLTDNSYDDKERAALISSAYFSIAPYLPAIDKSTRSLSGKPSGFVQRCS